MATDKDTIYIDIDDEITGIIDKLKVSEGKVVALVLPKRAAVFQSIVNMKLLKRAADSAKKNLVLITNEAGLLPLAGAAGVYVAKTLTSKPEIPVGPELIDDAEEMVQESGADGPIDSSKPVGELAGAGAGAAAVAPAAEEGVETLVLDDEDLPPEEKADDKPASKTFVPPPKKNKKLKVPNFERFRLLLALGALLLILLIAGIIYAATALPKATINVKTDATNVNANTTLNLSTTAAAADPASGTLPAKLQSQQKTYSQQVTTTGQKNNGNRASGTIAVLGGACGPNVPADVPAGTGVSSSNLTYITQDDITFQPVISHGKCTFQGVDNTNQQSSIPILAQSGGTSYNVSGVPFAVSGRSELTASGSTTGGTDNIVQTVNQNDINNAKAKISSNDSQEKLDIQNQLVQAGYYALTVTYTVGTPSVTASASVGDVATTVTVTENITYTMFGVHQGDLTTLLDTSVKSQIDTTKQSILDDGLSTANYNVTSMSAASAVIAMSTKAEVGPHLDTNAIKAAAAGQKAGAIKSSISSDPGVTGVDVNFSPFWVTTAPKKTSRITVNIAKPTTTQSSSSNGSGH